MRKLILPMIAGLTLLSCAVSKKSSITTTAKQDAVKKDSVKSNLKPYKEVITSKAITSVGLFKVHKIDAKYYFEIPDSLLNRDILIVNRISKGRFDGPASTYSGDLVNQKIIQLSKGPKDKLFFKEVSYDIRSADTSENGMYRAVQNSNVQPIITAFDIKALSPDSSGFVLDMTDYINGDNNVLFFADWIKRYIAFGLGSYHADKSYVEEVRSFPSNVEITTFKTYTRAGNGSFSSGLASFELNSSIVLLPEHPMQPRFMDKRVGYFYEGYYNFDTKKSVNIDWMINRWRLEPKEEDVEKYKRGELVEPKQPIVFYIDPATPKRWVPYLMQGVNDWKNAFEKAGFKNAIYALEAPADDSTWSIQDARHNVIVYKGSIIANANGPHISDPRSGEIIESHVQWYHNVQLILKQWYFIQASPNDPGARKTDYDEALMGELIRYVCAHEVGHTLGLQHNFGASSTMPTDSLRSKSYVKANGFCPSIMDYSRFNYVAQPEDHMDRADLMPRIGAYDEWAIEWGYKWLPDLKTKDQQKPYMNRWIINSLEKDKRLWFGEQTFEEMNFDPKRQNQDLGDDPVKASHYGIQNLKRIVPNLKEWTKIPNENYQSLQDAYRGVVQQYFNYLTHVFTVVGGIEWSDKSADQKGTPVNFPSKARQKSAIQFLQEELFTKPEWIMDKNISRIMLSSPFIAGDNNFLVFNYSFNGIILSRLMSHWTFSNLLLAESLQPNAYTLNEFLTDMDNVIYKELRTREPISSYRRDIQKLYLNRLMDQMDPVKLITTKYDKAYMTDFPITDVQTIVKSNLRRLLAKINAALPAYRDEITRLHLLELRDRIDFALNDKKADQFTLSRSTGNKSALDQLSLKPELLFNNSKELKYQSCWEEDSFNSQIEE